VGQVHARAQLNPRVVFEPQGCFREGMPREAIGELDEALDAKETYVRLSDGRRICLEVVELIDAN
jgi:hypothetical protein